MPKWFTIGDEIMWPTLKAAQEKLKEIEYVPRRVTTECAAIHLAHMLYASSEANKKGKHSIAISMMRQCVESLTVIELGVIPKKLGEKLVDDWINQKKSQGAIRQVLDNKVWSRYGNGLWQESWSEYFGNLASAVQPYAHYTPMLQGWQMVVPEGTPLKKTNSGKLKANIKYGTGTYDGRKATRITLLHILISWTVGRLIIENGGDSRINENDIEKLGKALANSKVLAEGNLSWDQQFWANEFWGIEDV